MRWDDDVELKKWVADNAVIIFVSCYATWIYSFAPSKSQDDIVMTGVDKDG